MKIDLDGLFRWGVLAGVGFVSALIVIFMVLAWLGRYQR